MKKIINNILTASNTKLFTVGLRDVIFSLYYAVGTSVAVMILPHVEKMTLPNFSEIKIAVSAGLVVGLQHIIRKFLTNSKGIISITPEKENAEGKVS